SGTIQQSSGGWYTHGTTGDSGYFSFYTFPGNINLRMNYNYATRSFNPFAVSLGVNTAEFFTSSLNIPGHTAEYQSSGWPSLSMPIELLQGSHNIRINQGGSNLGVHTVHV